MDLGAATPWEAVLAVAVPSLSTRTQVQLTADWLPSQTQQCPRRARRCSIETRATRAVVRTAVVHLPVHLAAPPPPPPPRSHQLPLRQVHKLLLLLLVLLICSWSPLRQWPAAAATATALLCRTSMLACIRRRRWWQWRHSCILINSSSSIHSGRLMEWREAVRRVALATSRLSKSPTMYTSMPFS